MDWRSTARVWRRRLHEAVGSPKHSRPALFDMDTQLLEYLPERDGVFVEAGANDGFNQSNTYFFERFRGWSGVLVEPVAALAAKATRLRRRSTVFNCALVSFEHAEGQVAMIHSDLMSLVKGAKGSPEEDLAWAQRGSSLHGQPVYDFSAPARTLSSVLDEAQAGRIDLLSLDVRGLRARGPARARPCAPRSAFPAD